MKQDASESGESSVREFFRQLLVGNATTTRAALLEKMFDSRRDIDDECGYPKNINAKQYRYMYDREGIATRVVSVYPEECWRDDPEIFETKEADETAWEATLKEVVKEHNIMHYLGRVDEMSGIGSFGVLLLGVDDGKTLDTPVAGVLLDGPNAGRKVGFGASVAVSSAKEGPGKAKPEKAGHRSPQPPGKDEPMVASPVETARHLLYLRSIDESLVDIVEWETDVTSRRFGMPKFYNIKFGDPSESSNNSHSSPDTTTVKVHWTRVIHVADNTKSSEVFGTPRMQIVFNRLYDLRKLLGGSAEMFWKGAFPGFSFEVNPDHAGEDFDSVSMRKEFEAYSNGLQRYLAVNGVTAKSLAVQVASPDDHVTVQLKAIAIAMKCPLRIFMGSEAAHLASTQDQKTWNGRLSHRQEKYLTPKIIRPFIDRLIAIGILPEPETGSYDVKWPDMDIATDEEKAKVAEILVKAIAAYVQAGMDTLVPPFEFLTMFIGLDQEQAKAIMDAAAEHLEEIEEIEAEQAAEDAEAMANMPAPDPNDPKATDPNDPAAQLKAIPKPDTKTGIKASLKAKQKG